MRVGAAVVEAPLYKVVIGVDAETGRVHEDGAQVSGGTPLVHRRLDMQLANIGAVCCAAFTWQGLQDKQVGEKFCLRRASYQRIRILLRRRSIVLRPARETAYLAWQPGSRSENWMRLREMTAPAWCPGGRGTRGTCA